MTDTIVRTILYAADLGLYGPFLLAHAYELARRHQARVYVVHAIEPIGVFADALLNTYVPESVKATLRHGGIDSVKSSIREQVRHAFEDDFIDFQGPRDWIADVFVVEGNPADVILSESERLGADLIVIGSHAGRGSINTPLGSVANKVLQLSTRPVYLIPTVTARVTSSIAGKASSFRTSK